MRVRGLFIFLSVHKASLSSAVLYRDGHKGDIPILLQSRVVKVTYCNFSFFYLCPLGHGSVTSTVGVAASFTLLPVFRV